MDVYHLLNSLIYIYKFIIKALLMHFIWLQFQILSLQIFTTRKTERAFSRI